MTRLRPWQVWWMDMGIPVGHEQGGVRPVVVVGSDLHCSLPIGVVFVASMTTRDRGLRHHVPVFSPDSGLRQTSYVLTEKQVTLSVERSIRYPVSPPDSISRFGWSAWSVPIRV